MVRTQLQLDDEVYQMLRQRAFQQKRSLSSVAREAMRRGMNLEDRPGVIKGKEFSFIGSGSSEHTDISIRHDDYLGEDFR